MITLAAMTRLQSILILVAFMALIYALTGPWETKDERNYKHLSAIASAVSFQQTTSKGPEDVTRCLQRLPPAILNLERLQAGSGVTLANPVQHVLLTVTSVDNGKSLITVRRPPDKPLRGSHRAAIVHCIADAQRKNVRNVVASGMVAFGAHRSIAAVPIPPT